jgi:hypothetical protein
MNEQDKALQGELGSSLWIVSSINGEKLAEYSLNSMPVWDGMAAAYNKLYLSMIDGKVIALEGNESK